jgi:hypothetical protein
METSNNSLLVSGDGHAGLRRALSSGMTAVTGMVDAVSFLALGHVFAKQISAMSDPKPERPATPPIANPRETR